MTSRTTKAFRQAFARLPENVRQEAKEAYSLFKDNPNHPSLRFKRIHATRLIYSIRISLSYRALGVRQDDEIIWFWIGSHAEYERLLSRL